MAYNQLFKVVTQSSNTNSFGLKQYVLVSKSGQAFKACKNPLFGPKTGETIGVPLILDKKGNVTGFNFAQAGFEIPEKLPNPPKEVLNEIFNTNQA